MRMSLSMYWHLVPMNVNSFIKFKTKIQNVRKLNVQTVDFDHNERKEKAIMLPMNYLSFRRCCCELVAERQIGCQMEVHNIAGSIVRVWSMDSCVVLDYFVYPSIVERVFWYRQLVLALQRPPLLHLQQPLRQLHYSFDCDATLMNAD